MKGLDRYLTTPPEDGYSEYFERLYEHLTEEQYNEMNEALFIESETEEKWVDSLMYKEIDPRKSAEIIYRAFKRFKDRL